MISSVVQWFTALSQREKILIGIFAMLLAATVGFYGIYRPVSGAVSDARERYVQSVERRGRIESKVTALTGKVENAASGPTGSTEAIINQSAGETGIAIGRVDPQGDGRVILVVDSAKPTALFGWLARLEARGVSVEILNVEPSGIGTLKGSITLRSLKPG